MREKFELIKNFCFNNGIKIDLKEDSSGNVFISHISDFFDNDVFFEKGNVTFFGDVPRAYQEIMQFNSLFGISFRINGLDYEYVFSDEKQKIQIGKRWHSSFKVKGLFFSCENSGLLKILLDDFSLTIDMKKNRANILFNENEMFLDDYDVSEILSIVNSFLSASDKEYVIKNKDFLLHLTYISLVSKETFKEKGLIFKNIFKRQ